MKYLKRLFNVIMALICMAIFMIWLILFSCLIIILFIPVTILFGIDNKFFDQELHKEIAIKPFEWCIYFLIKIDN